MPNVCLYLRKSRADEELENEIDTLARHKKTLFEYAKKHNLNIVKIHEELVSGESIIHRPEMIALLKEVEERLYDAVLCMDLQRLGRGDMEEQGLILKTFKNASTRIITPDKTYDLSNDFDEEYTEFESFMSRKEYKMIVRRMQRGVIRSCSEGNYISPSPPFGYLITGGGKNRSLIPHPEQADIVRMMFDLYANKSIGSGYIGYMLDDMGIKPVKGQRWQHNIVLGIIKNPVYIGKITWGRRTKDRKMKSESEWLIWDGKHEALISEELFNKAQEIRKNNYMPPVKSKHTLVNPLAGLIVCKLCGMKMKYRSYIKSEPHIHCEYRCPNKSSKLKYIEAQLLSDLKEMLSRIEQDIGIEEEFSDNVDIYTKNIIQLEKEIEELNKQKLKLHDFLERGIYDTDTFLDRSQNISERIEKAKYNIKQTNELIKKEQRKTLGSKDFAVKLREVVETYDLGDVHSKNRLLHDVLDKIIYLKLKSQRNDSFELLIYPKF